MSYTPGRFWTIFEQTGSEQSTALFSPAHSSATSWVPTYYTPLVKPIHGLISTFYPVVRLFGTSRPNISMGARVTVRVVPNMEALPCLQINEQTGSEPSTALFSPARSSSTSWVPTYYTPLVKPISKALFRPFLPWGGYSGQAGPIH